MANKIKLEVVSPTEVVYTADANMVIVRSSGGELGIMPGHAPFIAGLIPAPVRVKNEEGEMLLAVSGGFIEVQPTKITILATCAELGDKIDVERAEKARQRALERLNNKQSTIDLDRAGFALKRATARLKAAGRIIQ